MNRLFVIFLLGLVGIAPWLLISALFSQLPIFNTETPERFTIASYIVLLTQLGNVAASLFVFFLGRQTHWTTDFKALVCGRAILFVLVVETVASGCVGFLWQTTVNGSSIVLMLATVAGGLSGCMSVILVYPFTAPLAPVATVAMSTGMGLNALVTALLAIVQAPSQENRFSTTDFFIVITAILCLSVLAFLYLWLSDAHTRFLGLRRGAAPGLDEATDGLVNSDEKAAPPTLWSAARANQRVCFFQLLICFSQYVLLSLFSFAAAFFGADMGALLLYTNIAGNVLGPAARASSGFLALRSTAWLIGLTVAVQLLAVLLFAATFAPFMPIGLLGFVSVAMSIVYGFEETTLFTKVAVEAPGNSKAVASRAVGIANQVGACVGSLVGFGIANALYARST
jgi:hypothetical protein